MRSTKRLGCLLVLLVSQDPAHALPPPPEFKFTYVPPWGSSDDLAGREIGWESADCAVAVYINVGAWWTKPTAAEPLTPLQPDGTWTCDITTGGSDAYATRITAFLLPAGYSPPVLLGAGALPAELYSNALAVADVARPRTIDFSGLKWSVKSSQDPLGPGPNYFSDRAEDVWVDANGDLHLSIVYRDGAWYCSEVISDASFGYGLYAFYLQTSAAMQDPNTVVGLFTWDDLAPAQHYREIDVELAQWGKVGAPNAQYVVQPWDTAGNRFRFTVNQDTSTVHGFVWAPGRVDFFSCHGDARTAAPGGPITNWTYTGADVPTPGTEKVRLNFWLLGGAPPANGQPAEIVVKAFKFLGPAWLDSSDCGHGWEWQDWFGYFWKGGGPWMFHLEHGWLYPVGDTPGNLWLYSPRLNWLWTGDDLYPFLWSVGQDTWLWYCPGTGNTNGGWFYVFPPAGQWQWL
jgi:hypothetical protein